METLIPMSVAFALQNAKEQIIHLETQYQSATGVNAPFETSKNAIQYIDEALAELGTDTNRSSNEIK